MNLEYIRDTIAGIPDGISRYTANNGQTKVTILKNVRIPFSDEEKVVAANVAVMMGVLENNQRRRRDGNRVRIESKVDAASRNR